MASSRARHPLSGVSSISTEGSRVPRETATPQEIASVEVIAANAGSAPSRVVHFPVPNVTASRVDALAFGDKIAIPVSYCRRLPLGCDSGLGESRVGSHGSRRPPSGPALVAHAFLLGSGWRRSTHAHVPRRFADGFVVSGGSRIGGGSGHSNAARVRSVTGPSSLWGAVVVAGPWRRSWSTRGHVGRGRRVAPDGDRGRAGR